MRQDDQRVGLLHEKGIRNLIEMKQADQADGVDIASFVDTHLALNLLTTAAKGINAEF